MIRAMRAAVVVTTMHGGLLHYAVQLADGLARRGHDVHVLAPRDNELSAHRGAARMRAVLEPPIRSAVLPAGRLAYLRRRVGVAVRLARAWLQVNVAARRGRYDAVVIAEDLALPLAAAAVLALTLRPRRHTVAVVCHNVRPFNRWAGSELFDASRLSTALLGRLYPRCDTVFVHGEKSLADFRATWPPTRVAVIPHGDERLLGDPAPPADEERVLFFGDWRKVKGLSVLMEAFDALAGRRPAARLTIAGTPAPADYDPELVRRWAAGHDGRVEIIDRYVPIGEVAPLFARARVVATPYLVGYQSGVIHLAMTMARAVVTSDVGDLPDAVRDGESGLVVPGGDAARLADALEAVLADPALAARMGDEGRRLVMSGSDWDAVAERFEAALDG